MIKPKAVLVLAFCAFLFGAGCYLLVFAGAILCCRSGQCGESFWQLEKFLYGLLPMGISIVVFSVAARLWARAFVRRGNAWFVACILAPLVVLVDLSLILLWHNRRLEEINLAWEAESGTFGWGSGQVQLPTGFTYEAHRGIDTSVGRFTSRDGRLVILHDIGRLAGEYAGTGEFEETLSEGSRVKITHRKEPDGEVGTTVFAAVSFPDSGGANFYLTSSSEEHLATVDFIAQSFRPKGRTSSWMPPLLPELLRSDCGYQARPWWLDDRLCESTP